MHAERLAEHLHDQLRFDHLVDLALEPPEIEIAWLAPDTPASDHLVGAGNALYLGRRHAIVVSGIATIGDANKCAHEVGHGRNRSITGRLEGERAAWEFARDRMLV